MSFGYEKRFEDFDLNPDECLKLAPASCQGGAGGNLLPISGGLSLDEFFVEGYLPLVADMTFVQSLAFEFGFRTSDYDPIGDVDTWKAGLNWSPTNSLMVRVMQQEATRAPNVGELFSPVTTGLDNALLDPCSINNAANVTAALTALCVSTGMLAAQVGVIQDIVSGQINILEGSSVGAPPDAETADTFTAGIVWTPDLEIANITDLTLSVDYYDIDVEDVISEFSAQEVLNGCYVAGNAADCANIVRVDGDLTSPASGVQLFTTNLNFWRAEGVEIGFGVGFDLGQFGDLRFSGTINKYLENERQSSALTPVIDCNGFFGTSCDPVSELRWVQRTTWNWRDLSVSLQWRHIDSVDRERPESAGSFAAFRNIDDYDYLDLYASYSLFNDLIVLNVGIDNLTDEDPPVVGNEAGDTSSNSGNTFPSNYDVAGTIYKVGFTFSM